MLRYTWLIPPVLCRELVPRLNKKNLMLTRPIPFKVFLLEETNYIMATKQRVKFDIFVHWSLITGNIFESSIMLLLNIIVH